MENLNAENIINEIQSLIKALKDCGGWVKRGNGEGWFNHEILADALALITSQEQKIFELENRLKECENGYKGTNFLDRCKLRDAEEKVKKLTEELDDLKRDTIPKLKNGLERANTMGVEADKKIAELTEENERLRGFNSAKCEDCAGCTVWNCDCANIEAQAKADTVQKYKSAIIKYYSKPTYQPTKEHPIKHTQIEHLFAVLDQIAKEMLEGEK